MKMKRVLFWPRSTILLLGVLALPACGPQDSPEAVIADCGGHIPREKIGHCLERAHAVEQTNPSAQLQSLAAELERRANRHREIARQNAPPDYAPDQNGRPETRVAEEAPDRSVLGYDMPPDDGAQGPPPDDIRPPDDSETQGPGQ
jgi:hypothetical protein